MEDLEDTVAWFLPRKKGRDGKSRQLKKNRKKFLKKNKDLIEFYKNPNRNIIIETKVEIKGRGIYGSTE